MKKALYIPALIAAFAAQASASAASDNPWRVGMETESGEVVSIVSGTSDTNGIYFNCNGGSLQVGLGVVPGDIEEMLATRSTRRRSHSVNTTIGSAEPVFSDWTYYPSLKVAVGKDTIIAKKFYNAAVKGEQVTWKMPWKDEVVLSFPPINEAFTSFANDCPVTNPKT